MYRIGVDVGGTFTDFTVLDDETLDIFYHKVSSTSDDPSRAIRDGTAEVLKMLEIAPSAVAFVGHGTTVATNLIIERRGVKTGLLTTRGFRDILEIGRQTRPDLFDYTITKPPPLVPRALRLELAERIDASGAVLTALDETEVERAVLALKAKGVQAIAVCFLHSYRNGAHERAVRAIVERLLPDGYVCASSDILSEFREYERLSTTVLNAYVGPRMQTYLDRLASGMAGLGVHAPPYTVHSNGGLMSIPTARRFPVRTCLSGPAAGVVGAAAVSAASDCPNLITFDVGGTSTDVSLILDRQPLFTSHREVADYPVRTPMVDVQVIGAGGGSIVWIDDAGALKVGPHSAGADPGPVAYDRGGTRLTITDVNVCLQRLDPVALLGGRLPINARKARAAVEAQIARPLGLDVDAAAFGALRVVNSNMSRAIRSVSTERGHDLAKVALFAYGGAGPLHACEVAAECGIPRVVVPQQPGTMCARGILLADLTLDFVRTDITTVTAQTWANVTRLFAEMTEEGDRWLAQEGVVPDARRFRRRVDSRYGGQNYEIAVEIDDLDETGGEAFLNRFRDVHAREYGYAIAGRNVEIVNCRLQAIGKVPRAPLKSRPAAAGDPRVGSRRIFFGPEAGWVETDVLARDRLRGETPMRGPAIIEEMSSTTVVPPDHAFAIDPVGNIVIEVPHVA